MESQDIEIGYCSGPPDPLKWGITAPLDAGGRNIPSAFLRRYNIFREMATTGDDGAKKAAEKSVSRIM